jgi:hypothetical protein
MAHALSLVSSRDIGKPAAADGLGRPAGAVRDEPHRPDTFD